jgi:hypothetical protein
MHCIRGQSCARDPLEVKGKGIREVGGVADKEANIVHIINIISQRQYFVALVCKHPVCYYYIIGYLLTFNTRFVFSSFSIFGYGDMFRYQYTILRPILQMLANN